MPFHTITTDDGIEVESELLVIPLKIYDSPKRRNRIFSCQIHHIGDKRARIMCGHGRLGYTVVKALRQWLKANGYTSYTFERGDPKEGQRLIGGLIDK